MQWNASGGGDEWVVQCGVLCARQEERVASVRNRFDGFCRDSRGRTKAVPCVGLHSSSSSWFY